MSSTYLIAGIVILGIVAAVAFGVTALHRRESVDPLPPAVRYTRPIGDDDDKEPERADCARKWDWLKRVKYPYFFAYEEEPWPETPEHDLGSRPWIYP